MRFMFLASHAQFWRPVRTSRRYFPCRQSLPQTQMLWPSKSHEKSGVSHTPVFHLEGLGQIRRAHNAKYVVSDLKETY